jgi:predicted ABC-type ATPase
VKPRLRFVAGPNGSGKTTLMRRLAADYAVNFYDVINADDIFAEVARTGAYAPRMPVDSASLLKFALASSYGAEVKTAFIDSKVQVKDDCIVFAPDAVNSYTVALVAAFLQHEFILERRSFSQETVFSHPSKIEALREARRCGFRTYLYFVATEDASINAARVENRAALGGHFVPPGKIASRFPLSIENAAEALRYLSRAYFFDNSGETMRFLAEWDETRGISLADGGRGDFPNWLAQIAAAAVEIRIPGRLWELDGSLAAPAAAASREAISQAFAAGLPVTVLRGGRIVRLSPEGEEIIMNYE